MDRDSLIDRDFWMLLVVLLGGRGDCIVGIVIFRRRGLFSYLDIFFLFDKYLFSIC